MDEVTGVIHRVIYNRGDYYALSFTGYGHTPSRCSVAGNVYGLSTLKSGISIKFLGQWKNHKKFGRQFAIKSWEPWSVENYQVEYFLHACVDGFQDRDVARWVASKFGTYAFETLTKEPSKILALEGSLPRKLLESACLGWERSLAARDLSLVLKDGGLAGFEVQAAIARFGNHAPKIIKENPYSLMEVPGLRFQKVDQLAFSLGLTSDDPRRVEGAVLWSLREAAKDGGHLYLSRGEIPAFVHKLTDSRQVLPVSADFDAFMRATQNLVDREALVLDPKAGVYLPEVFHFERESAKMVASFLGPSEVSVELQPFVESYERSNQLSLSEAQRLALEKLVDNKVLVLTGLPGTGKTSTVRAIVRMFEQCGISFSLMAPTGIAAKRLAAVTGKLASTIHRALGYDGSEWRLNQDIRFVVDAVIVDEVSMVDQELLYRLLSALRPETMLVLVGDDAQLPSVGAGNVLRELLACPDVPNVRLTQIFRQSEKGDIVLNSHRIYRGETLNLEDPRSDTEFKFLRVSDEERIADLIVEMSAKMKAKDANFQVLSPKYEGVVGVDHLNSKLRDRLNPAGPAEWKEGGLHLRVGDRVMVIQNDYKLNVYNGDAGKLVAIHPEALVVRIHGVGKECDAQVEFPLDVAKDKLKLAYAITVHRCQGSEFDNIIMPVVRSQGRMLQRNLLYTAVTRARKRVWLIGEESAIQKAIQNNKVVQRNTCLGRAVSEAIVGVQSVHEGGES